MAKLRNIAAAMLALVLAGPLAGPASAQEEGDPQQGGTLNVVIQPEPPGLMIGLLQNAPTQMVAPDIYESLLRYNFDLSPEPQLAESWEISEDGKTYTFHLRDANWSDGEPVTAEDFVYAWRRAVDPATHASYAYILYPVANAEAIVNGEQSPDQLAVRAIDDHTLEVTLVAPTPLHPHTSQAFPSPAP